MSLKLKLAAVQKFLEAADIYKSSLHIYDGYTHAHNISKNIYIPVRGTHTENNTSNRFSKILRCDSPFPLQRNL